MGHGYGAYQKRVRKELKSAEDSINSFARGWLKQNAEKYGWYYSEGK